MWEVPDQTSFSKKYQLACGLGDLIIRIRMVGVRSWGLGQGLGQGLGKVWAGLGQGLDKKQGLGKVLDKVWARSGQGLDKKQGLGKVWARFGKGWGDKRINK